MVEQGSGYTVREGEEREMKEKNSKAHIKLHPTANSMPRSLRKMRYDAM